MVGRVLSLSRFLSGRKCLFNTISSVSSCHENESLEKKEKQRYHWGVLPRYSLIPSAMPDGLQET